MIAAVQLRVISWNLFHGRDAPPNRALYTWRSRLLRITERDATHVQVNRDLFDEFAAMIATARWDLALLQEAPPRWTSRLAEKSDAEAQVVLTSRNWLARPSHAIARISPDLIASHEGGSNLTLVRRSAGSIVEGREIELRRRPERRMMGFARLESGLCVANLHVTNDRPPLAEEEIRTAAETATAWASDAPLLFGGDFNVRPTETDLYDALERRFGLAGPTSPTAIDHVLARGLQLVEKPRAWPDADREVAGDGLRIRLSDHSPVEGVWEMR
jgi:endonuclease/exonuclease/phosphatase family metal-dependent hydrolase